MKVPQPAGWGILVPFHTVSALVGLPVDAMEVAANVLDSGLSVT